MQDRLITPDDLAVLANRSLRTIQQWRFRGYGPPYVRTGYRTIKYDRLEVEKWLAEQQERSVS